MSPSLLDDLSRTTMILCIQLAFIQSTSQLNEMLDVAVSVSLVFIVTREVTLLV